MIWTLNQKKCQICSIIDMFCAYTRKYAAHYKFNVRKPLLKMWQKMHWIKWRKKHIYTSNGWQNGAHCTVYSIQKLRQHRWLWTQQKFWFCYHIMLRCGADLSASPSVSSTRTFNVHIRIRTLINSTAMKDKMGTCILCWRCNYSLQTGSHPIKRTNDLYIHACTHTHTNHTSG